MNRSLCIGLLLAGSVLVSGGNRAAVAQPAPADRFAALAESATGKRSPRLDGFEEALLSLMDKWKLPGAAAAVAKSGRLVYSRGFGLADVDKNQAMPPDALFRIASISKPITAAAILKLVEQGRLDLAGKAFGLFANISPPAGKQVDPRLASITIRQLLQHTGGFDRGKSFDPMFQPGTIAKAVGVQPPPGPSAILRFMKGQPLDFDPGSRYAYSNFGYSVLGRIIEKVTGQSYEQATLSLVLAPAGITRMRLGHTRLRDRAEGEVHYHAASGPAPQPSVFPGEADAPAPYGGFYVEAFDAHGGWIASPVDLVRFVTALDGSRPPALLKPETVRLFETRPRPPLPADASHYYGLGWSIATSRAGASWRHTGDIPGTSTILVREASGVTWCVLFNSNGADGFYHELEGMLSTEINQIEDWPRHDLFGSLH